MDNVIENNRQKAAESGNYAIAREAHYPPLSEQIGAQWKIIQSQRDGVEPPADALAVLQQVQDVKAQFPKPTQGG